MVTLTRREVIILQKLLRKDVEDQRPTGSHHGGGYRRFDEAEREALLCKLEEELLKWSR